MVLLLWRKLGVPSSHPCLYSWAPGAWWGPRVQIQRKLRTHALPFTLRGNIWCVCKSICGYLGWRWGGGFRNLSVGFLALILWICFLWNPWGVCRKVIMTGLCLVEKVSLLVQSLVGTGCLGRPEAQLCFPRHQLAFQERVPFRSPQCAGPGSKQEAPSVFVGLVPL